MINQTKESWIFFNLSLLPLSFLPVSLKPNIVLNFSNHKILNLWATSHICSTSKFSAFAIQHQISAPLSSRIRLQYYYWIMRGA
jgi:hypothetical protein